MQTIIRQIIIWSCLIPFLGSAQLSFYKLFTNNGYDFGQGVVQLEDSSYVITGSSSSFEEGAAQAFLLKIDSTGNYLWSHAYGGAESEGGRRVMYQKNWGFYVAGYSNSFGAGDFDAYLVKTDEDGNKLWEKNYGGTGWENINDAALLADTGILMVGKTNSGTAGNDNLYMVRTDKNGDTIWTKNWGGSGTDFASCMRKIDDTHYVIAGQYYNSDSLFNKGYLIYLNINGTIEWESQYGDNGNYTINDLHYDGNYIHVVGKRVDPITSNVDSYMARIDLYGTKLFERAFVKDGFESYELITDYGSEGKYYIAFNEELEGTTYPIGKDLTISRFSSSLNWDTQSLLVRNTGDDIGGQLISTSDGGAIIVGYNTTFGAGGRNVFVAKIGPGDVFPDTYSVPTIEKLVEIEEHFIEKVNGYKLYPNPAQEGFTIELPEAFEGSFILSDIRGKVIDQQEIKLGNSGSTLQFSTEAFEKGNYFISIYSKEGNQTVLRFSIY